MSTAGMALVASLGALLLLAVPAGAARDRDSGPLRIWSVSELEQGARARIITGLPAADTPTRHALPLRPHQ
jgi:hypothetical protein